ncbi:MAG: hypothetical protein KJ697_01595 [Nanoarchaeota archaeon]|nr:hypothetical protein [Nanoarchaeota archaeon]
MVDIKKKDVSTEELEVALLYKMFIMRAGIKRHIYESDLPKGFPSHLRKDIMNVAKELNRKGFLVEFPHGKEHAWQLNLNRIDEIRKKIEKFYTL